MHNLTTWYHEQTTEGKLNFDDSQLELLEELDIFLDCFANNGNHPLLASLKQICGLNFITRLLPQQHKLGYYIYGDVGRGKSMIMNMMYQYTSGTRKTRLHFHEFMQEVHQQLATLATDEPLKQIASALKEKFDIIYLDEMHVSDIATAMIMKRLLESLFANQIYVVTSSNYPPDGLWPNGLMRERFLPAIETLKERLNVLSLNAKQDYRLFNNSINRLFVIQHADARMQLGQIFAAINKNQPSTAHGVIEICQRQINYLRRGEQIIWFDFGTLCGDMRSQLDYLELAKRFKWFIISDIFLLTADKKDVARRFTWLIDILYDCNCKLALSSAVLIQDIYCHGDFANEFTRTISRLEEMQTDEYLQKNLTAPC